MIIICIFIFTTLFCQDYPPIEGELQGIQTMLDSVENEVVELPASVKSQPVIKPKKETGAFGVDSLKVKVEDAPKEGGIYDYGLIANSGNDNSGNGSWIFAFNGEYAKYKGLGLDFGWQYNFKFVSFVTAIGFGYRTNSLFDTYSLAFKLESHFRPISWLNPFVSIGTEFVKISGGDFVYPYFIGGGLMFRIGRLDPKAEFSLYKKWGIKRTYLVLAIYSFKHSQDLLALKYIFKFGLSFEF